MYTGGKLFVSLMLIFSLLFVLSACAPLPTAVSQEFKPLYYTDGTPVAGTGKPHEKWGLSLFFTSSGR